MLERLDEIDWYRFGHAYGDAADVPRMIRALTSPDEEVREQANPAGPRGRDAGVRLAW